MKFTYILILVLSAFAVFSGCERPGATSSRVQLQLPSYASKSDVSGRSSCTKCLKQIILNVNSADMPPIFFKYGSNEDSSASRAGELSGEIEIEVPVGKQRSFSLLALYSDEENNGALLARYGSVTRDLLANEEIIEMQMVDRGEFRGGRISGRYLTSATAGPTGAVSVIWVDEKSGTEIKIAEERIENGWFSFQASSNNTGLVYRLSKDEKPLFGGAVSTESLRPTTLTNQHVAHVRRPAVYYSSPSPGTYTAVKNTGDLIFGFFGDASYLTDKKVCLKKHGSPVNLTKLYKYNAANNYQLLTYQIHTTGVADIEVRGGLEETTSPCSNLVPPYQIYTEPRIGIHFSQFDTVETELTHGQAGAFTFSVLPASGDGKAQRISAGSGSALHDYKVFGIPSTFVTRPLTADATFEHNGARIFKKTLGAGENISRLQCTDIWLAVNGLTEVPSVEFRSPPYVAGNDILFKMKFPQAGTETFVACPTRSGVMTATAGTVLGKFAVTPPADIALATIACTGVQGAATLFCSLNIFNGSPLPVQLLNMMILTQSHVGTFVPTGFPSGTCSGEVNPGQSCNASVQFTPLGVPGNRTATIQIGYRYLNSAITTTRSINYSATVAPSP